MDIVEITLDKRRRRSLLWIKLGEALGNLAVSNSPYFVQRHKRGGVAWPEFPINLRQRQAIKIALPISGIAF